MKKPKPLKRFIVYAENNKPLHFIVYVWKNKRDMYAACASPPNNFSAICMSYEHFRIFKSGREKILPDLGKIHFIPKSLTVGIIAHECTHAALTWADRMKILKQVVDRDPEEPRASKYEERFCYVLGKLSADIAWKTRNVWKK